MRRLPEVAFEADSHAATTGQRAGSPRAGPDYARRVSLILMSLVGLSQGFIGPIVKLVNFAPLPLVVGRSLAASLVLHLICLLTGRRLH